MTAFLAAYPYASMGALAGIVLAGVIGAFRMLARDADAHDTMTSDGFDEEGL